MRMRERLKAAVGGNRGYLATAALVAGVGAYVFFFGPAAGTQAATYVTADVTKATVVAAVTGTGQVEATQQLVLKAKGGGDVESVYAKKGDATRAGDLLVQIGTADAEKTVRDAQLALATAQVSLAKLRKPPDAASLLSARNALADATRQLADLRKPPDAAATLSADDALASAQAAKASADASLASARDDGLNAVSDAHLDLLSTTANLDAVLTGHDLDPAQENAVALENSVYGPKHDELLDLVAKAQDAYTLARTAYDANFAAYAAASRYASPDEVDGLIDQTVDTAKAVVEAVQREDALVHFVDDELTRQGLAMPTAIAGFESDLADDTSTMNGRLSTLLSRQKAIRDAKQAQESAVRDIAAKRLASDTLAAGAAQEDLDAATRTVALRQATLDALAAGADPLDLQAARLTVQSRQDALADAEEKLADYSVRAPFDGTVADVAVKAGDAADAGTALVTVITHHKLAHVSLNETDVAKVKEGQKATLTFDAVPDLQATGQVASVDVLGTIAQGVVSYGVDIAFDVDDDRVKPGMTSSVSIIVAVATDVLSVPNAALKSGPTGETVQVLDGTAPRTVPVTTGVAGDATTEVVSGLTEGQKVVTQTVDPKAKTTTAATARGGIGGIPGLGGASGGAVRLQAR